ncbi:MAG: TraB family protein, partial [Proteobacteria bacterium]
MSIDSPDVSRISLQGKDIHLIGTAHISRQSVELVEQVIDSVRPDTVAIELCDSRYQSLSDPNRWRNTDIVKVIRSGRAYVLMVQLILAGFQKRLGEKLNIKPGAEMMKAAEIADDRGIPIVLADREVRITLKRTWSKMGFISMMKLFFSAIFGGFGDLKLDEQEIERMKRSDALDEMMREFSEALPEVRSTLIDERDQYLAAKIREAPG